MSKFQKVFSAVTGLLGGSTPKINIPQAEIPAAPAPTSNFDTGATITVGQDPTKDNRVSANTRKKKGSTSVDILGGLGLGNIGISL